MCIDDSSISGYGGALQPSHHELFRHADYHDDDIVYDDIGAMPTSRRRVTSDEFYRSDNRSDTAGYLPFSRHRGLARCFDEL